MKNQVFGDPDFSARGAVRWVCQNRAMPPLRLIRALVDEDSGALNRRFEGLYSTMGCPSIPPEMLLRATLLQAFFSVRSERMLMEQDLLPRDRPRGECQHRNGKLIPC